MAGRGTIISEDVPMAVTEKQKALRIIDEQPEDSSYEEIIRELIFARMIERGLADSEAGRTVGTEELERRIATWAR